MLKLLFVVLKLHLLPRVVTQTWVPLFLKLHSHSYTYVYLLLLSTMSNWWMESHIEEVSFLQPLARPFIPRNLKFSTLRTFSSQLGIPSKLEKNPQFLSFIKRNVESAMFFISQWILSMAKAAFTLKSRQQNPFRPSCYSLSAQPRTGPLPAAGTEVEAAAAGNHSQTRQARIQRVLALVEIQAYPRPHPRRSVVVI